MADEEQETGEERPPEGKPNSNRWRRFSLRKWLLLLGGGALFGALFFVWVQLYAAARPHGEDEKARLVFIPSGSGFAGVKKALVEARIIDDDIRFVILARLSGAAARMQAGEYLFPPELTHRQIIAKLAAGQVHYRPLTVPEGATTYQIADLLADGFDYDRELVLKRIRDPELISSFGLAVPSLEGYLFPDTYHLTRGQSLDAVLAMMVERFERVYAEAVRRQAGKSSPANGLSRHEIVILASIVEKETALAEERPLVAAVFYNRLRDRMKLQADPTVIYGMANFAGNITREDLLTPTPYNTYTVPGLPVGPIANPGRESLTAVLAPAKSDALYFVAKNDGSNSHVFSRTLEEHNRAVHRYQRQGRTGEK
ncbi:MAG: endolytic transglycosylase MltG [Thermodesulfobacteriota bacterium]